MELLGLELDLDELLLLLLLSPLADFAFGFSSGFVGGLGSGGAAPQRWALKQISSRHTVSPSFVSLRAEADLHHRIPCVALSLSH